MLEGMFLTTPDHASQPPAAAGADRTIEVTVVAMGASESILPEWRALIDDGLEDAPFASPEFIVPAAAQLTEREAPSLVTVWESVFGVRRLIGLFPMASGARAFERWGKPARAAFWTHPHRPFRTPALAGPEATARRSIGAFLDWLCARPGITSLDAGALPVDSIAARLLAEEAGRRQLRSSTCLGPARTHGFDFRPALEAPSARQARVTTDPAALRRTLEQILCLDEASPPQSTLLSSDPREPAFLRAALRSFALRGRAAIAVIDDADVRAGALAVLGRNKTYLWRILGRDARDLTIESALVRALERRLGMPVVAAAAGLIAGVGSEAGETANYEIGLSGGAPSMMPRLHGWVGSGMLL